MGIWLLVWITKADMKHTSSVCTGTVIRDLLMCSLYCCGPSGSMVFKSAHADKPHAKPY